jgi:colanic acid biosynthesis glycosyl transferase WcaI
VEESKILLVWDWLDSDFIRPQPRANELSTSWRLEGCFVVLYAGNMSFSQGLESVLAAAALLRNEGAIQFVFVGGGAAKNALQEQAARQGLTNVRFFPFQPRQLLPLVLAAADVSLICLKHGVSSDSVPSKFYSILASARPVVAAVDRNSDTWRMVQKAGCGVCVEPEDPEALAAAVLELYGDEGRRATMAASGREYAVTHHGRAAAAEKFHEALSSLAQGGRRDPHETRTAAITERGVGRP